MGFVSGSVTFRRFKVVGKAPKLPDEKLLTKLEEFQLQVGEYGIPDETEYGWCGGRHVLDTQFTFENNVFADAILFALRIDTNRVPGELKKAYQLIEEDALAKKNPSGFLSKKQKQDAKETVKAKLDDDLRQGKYRRSKLVPILWNLPLQTLYSPASSSAIEKLAELFNRTFDLELEPESAGSAALDVLRAAGKKRDYEDFRPTRFVHGPEGEGQHPDYAWTAKGPQPKDFLGNEFLLWLWHEVEKHAGTVGVPGGDVNIVIDKALDLDCAYGITGRDFLRGDGPTQMPEARDGLRSGKVPRKMGMILESGGNQFQLAFGAELFAFNAAKLPKVEEAENPRVLFEERIGLLRELCKAMDGLFETFLKLRASSSWEGQTGAIRRWITASKPAAAAAVA